MKHEARAGTRASAYERLRAIARSSCCFDMLERPGIFKRFGLVVELLLLPVADDPLRSDELRLRDLLLDDRDSALPFSCCARLAISPPFGRSVCPPFKAGNSRLQTRSTGYAGWLTQTKEALDDGLRTRTM